jgi:glycerol kinase
MAGATIQWLRDGLGIIQSSAEVEGLATSVPHNGGVHLVPAFTGLGAPYWDANAKAAIVGLSRGSHKAHIARAALESIALQTTALVNAMNQDAVQSGGQVLSQLKVDGGASANSFLMQFQADLLGVPVLRPKITESTAMGAAYLAGLGAGIWQNTQELQQYWQLDQCFEPVMSRDQALQAMHDWDKAVQQVRCHSLS